MGTYLQGRLPVLGLFGIRTESSEGSKDGRYSKAALLVIGEKILRGSLNDRNCQFVGKFLTRCGISHDMSQRIQSYNFFQVRAESLFKHQSLIPQI